MNYDKYVIVWKAFSKEDRHLSDETAIDDVRLGV